MTEEERSERVRELVARVYVPSWQRVVAEILGRWQWEYGIFGWAQVSARQLAQLGRNLAIAGYLGGEYRRGYSEAIATVGRPHAPT